MDVLIEKIDKLINKESRKLSQDEIESLLTLQNDLFDMMIQAQEDNDILKMKHDNKRAWEFIELKNETNEWKKTHTDKTAEAYLDWKYEVEEIKFLSNKFMFETMKNKNRLLQEKLQLAKKYLSVNN